MFHVSREFFQCDVSPVIDFCRDADDKGTWWNVGNDAGTGTDDGTFADNKRLAAPAVDDVGAGSDISTAFQVHPAGDMHARRQGCEIFHDDVMAERAVNIDLNVLAKGNVGRQDGTCTDNGAVADLIEF